jgi:hypothetical protein
MTPPGTPYGGWVPLISSTHLRDSASDPAWGAGCHLSTRRVSVTLSVTLLGARLRLPTQHVSMTPPVTLLGDRAPLTCSACLRDSASDPARGSGAAYWLGASPCLR